MTRSRVQAVGGQIALFWPAGVLGVMWLVWVGANGGYFPQVWYPSLVIAAELLVITSFMRGSVLPAQPAARCAWLAFAGLVALSYLSILWSGSRDGALEASNKLLLYLLAGGVLANLPWTPRALATMLGALSLGAAAFAVVGLIHATSATNLDSFFVQLRYSRPLGYPNATAALGVMGTWPALIISTRPEVPRAVRALCLPVAVFLCEFTFLPQSRAALVGLFVTLPLALLFAANRLRLLVRCLVVAGGLAVVVPRTIHLDDVITVGARVRPALHAVISGVGWTSAAAAGIGVALALLEGRRTGGRAAASAATETPGGLDGIGTRDPRRRRGLALGHRGRIALVAAALVVLLGAGALAASPVRRLVHTVYHSGQVDAGTGSTRLLSTTPEERFDYVRVAIRLFTDAPVVGVGAGNFARRYDGLRRFPKHSQYVHDVAFRTLSETGLLGFSLLAVVVLALSVGLVRASRRLDELARACVVIAILLSAYFLIHDSLDWLDEFPALAVPALGIALAAIGLRPASAGEPAGGDSGPGRLVTLRGRRGFKLVRLAGFVVLAVAFALAVYGPFLSERYVARALKTFASNPSAAYSDLSRAASLNPWSTSPATTEGEIAEQLQQTSRAREAYRRALRIERDWYPLLQLALLDASDGNFAAALREVNQAGRLDVDDPLIPAAKDLIYHRQRVDPVAFNQMLFQGANTSLFQSQKLR